MPRFATTITIAGISFSGCRGVLINGEEFADSVRGSVNFGNDSTPIDCTIDTLFKGVLFGIDLGSDDGAITIVKLNQTLNAIKAARNSVGYFVFVYVDETINLNLNCIQDFNQQWYSKGEFSEGYIKGIQFRFIVKSANAVSLSS